ncbi:D-glycero-beta-D-manno-heptose-7-phosphate kinase [Candidatus Nitrospira nitrificans]|uniref:D-beta-D-heptose 7-phosphate kinase, domain I of bifunctional protein HldE n=1 Tax=Candidatus Nitrospira nitrificans TaxID=1742973 RepID=A0A0S4L9R9_9BACT|nr:D-glycero-beta-D-manno-heptose-7-phosphate kinase [Candidatus Nitrospira nitrificans]CUS33376.1 D-beta-D-heptose 7-phosphate kinase, domain I of bifunctional protein HldE [Candidatus Nitrospira nitrificans]
MGTIRKGDSITKRGAASLPSEDSNGKGDALSPKALRQYLQRFPQASILVVGDLILDHYVMGRVSRISPEAPVPVVHVESESLRLGGAANVFNNILALGGKPDLCGVIGSDESGRLLMKELGNKRSSRGGVVIDHDRPTTRKSRVIAHNQQIVRYDIEGRSELKVALRQKLLRYVELRMRELSCIVVSDYAKGVVSSALMSDLIRLAALRKVPVIVDPKVEHFSYYKGVTVLTPNHLEAAQASGLHGDGDQTIDEAGAMIRQRLGCQSVLITRGEKGMSLYERNGASWHLPTKARQVYDVTGAGDTVIGTLALALAAGASIKTGAVMANYAAGIVVGMVGTATVSPKQLSEAFGDE